MGDPSHVEFSACSNLTLLIITTVGILFPKNLILQDSNSHESGEEAVSILACIKSGKKINGQGTKRVHNSTDLMVGRGSLGRETRDQRACYYLQARMIQKK